MYPKYKLLSEYLDISFKELFRNLYIKFENIHPNIDLNQEVDDYCYLNNLDTCQTMDVIEHTKYLRKLFTEMVDSLIDKYNLTIEYESKAIRPTIFDNIPKAAQS